MYLCGLVGALTLAFWPGVQHLASSWIGNDNYSHGLLLMPISLFLLSEVMRDTETGQPDTMSLGLAVILAVFLAVGQLLGLVVVFQLFAPILVLMLLTFCYGRKAFLALLAPALLLYFSIPIWDAINPVLQSLTVSAVSRIVYFVGIPAFVSGNQVTVSTGVFEIAAGCSGLRFFIISTAVAALYGHWYVARVSHAVVLILLAAMIAIVGNWIRVLVVIQMGVHLGIDHPQVVDHDFVGWVVFVGTMIVWFWIASKVPEKSAKETNRHGVSPRAVRPLIAMGVCGVAALCATVLQASLVSSAEASPPTLSESGTSRVGACGTWQSEYASTTAVQRSAFVWQGDALCLDLVWYSSHRQAALASADEWSLAGVRRKHVASVDTYTIGQGETVVVVTKANGDGLWVAKRRFVGDRVVENTLQERWLRLLALMNGQLDRSVIAIAQRCDSDCRAGFRSGEYPVDIRSALDAAVRDQLVSN